MKVRPVSILRRPLSPCANPGPPAAATIAAMLSIQNHLAQRVRAAAAERRKLDLRGGGSKTFYGNVGIGEPLDLTPLRGIVSYEPSELVITAHGGTPLLELEAELARCGQCLPFEPPHFGWSHAGPSRATVGGMVAAGLSGPARASVGSVRDFVLGAEMLNGRGQWLRFGGQVMKNVAGYDLSRLLAGTLGTLGVIGTVSLKVLPQAAAEATLRFDIEQPRALAQLQRWAGQPLPLNASCWLRDATDGNRECLLVRLRGARAAVESACCNITRELAGTRLDAAVAGPHWSACRDQRLPFFSQPQPAGMALWRLSLPSTAQALELPWSPLIEWHGALRWLWAPLAEADRLHTVAAEHAGHATLFVAHGAAATGAKTPFDSKSGEPMPRFARLSPVLATLQRRLKAEFDPAGIFNPGRLYPDL